MTNKQNFRHELKYRITQAHKDIMMARLDMFLDRDNNTENVIIESYSVLLSDRSTHLLLFIRTVPVIIKIQTAYLEDGSIVEDGANDE